MRIDLDLKVDCALYKVVYYYVFSHVTCIPFVYNDPLLLTRLSPYPDLCPESLRGGLGQIPVAPSTKVTPHTMSRSLKLKFNLENDNAVLT